MQGALQEFKEEKSAGIEIPVRLARALTRGAGPQRIAICEVTAEKETQVFEMNYTHQYAQQFAQTAHFSRQDGLSLSLSNLEPLPDAGSSFSWYQTPYKKLDMLLERAKGGQCDQITQSDLNYVVRCFGYTIQIKKLGVSIVKADGDYSQGLKEKAIEIISYIAQHHRILPKQTIAALIAEIKYQSQLSPPFSNLNLSNLNTTILALSYAICSGQNEQCRNMGDAHQINLSVALRKGINRLKNYNTLAHFETIIIGLAALGKLGDVLLHGDMIFIKHALTWFSENSHKCMEDENGNLLLLYGEKGSASRTNLNPKNGISILRGDFAELERIEGELCAKKPIAEKELIYLANCWDKKIYPEKAILLIRRAFFNENQKIPQSQYKRFIQILSTALESPDRKIRINAMIAVRYLIKYGELDETLRALNDISLATRCEATCTPSKKYALDALGFQKRNQGLLEKEAKEEISPLLETLIDGLEQIKAPAKIPVTLETDECASKAKYLLFALAGKLEKLNSLLFKKTYCVSASLSLYQSALSGIFPEDLKTFFKNAERLFEGAYPIEAKINVAMVLGELSRIKAVKILPKSILVALISRLGNQHDPRMVSAAMVSLGESIAHHFSDIVSPPLLIKISDFLAAKEHSLNASIFLVKLIDAIKDAAHVRPYLSTFEKLFEDACIALLDLNTTEQVKDNIILFLKKAAEHKFNLPQNAIAVFSRVVAEKGDDTQKLKIVAILGHWVQATEHPHLSPPAVDALIGLLRSQHDTLPADAIGLLRVYFLKTKDVCSPKQIENLTQLLLDKNKDCLLIELLDVIYAIACDANRVSAFFDASMRNLSHLLSYDSREIKCKVLVIYQKLSTQKVNFTPYVMGVFEHFLQHLDSQIEEEFLEMLKNISSRCVSENKQFHLNRPDITTFNLAKIVSNEHYSISSRLNALLVLENISKEYLKQRQDQKKLSIEVLDSLKDIMKHPQVGLSQGVFRILLDQIVLWPKRVQCNQTIEGILSVAQECIPHETTCHDSLLLLEKFQSIGYQPSVETLGYIAIKILYHKSKEFRECGFNILRCSKEKLTPKNYDIFYLEHCCRLVLSPKNESIERLSSIKKIKNRVLAGFITPGVFDMLSSVIQENNPVLSDEALEIAYLVATNGHAQLFPNTLIDYLGTKMLDPSNQGEWSASILSACIQNKVLVKNNILCAFEKLIADKEQVKVEYLEVMEIVLSRDYKPSAVTIRAILSLLADPECQDAALRIGESLVHLQYDLTDYLEELLSCRVSTEEPDAVRFLDQLIADILSKKQGMLKAEMVEKLFELLGQTEDMHAELEVIGKLELALHQGNLDPVRSKKISQAVAVRKIEHQLLDQQDDPDTQVQLLNSLVGCEDYFTFRTIQTVERLFAHEKHLPFLLDFLSKWEDRKIPSNLLEIVQSVFMDHQDKKLRAKAYDILQKSVNHPDAPEDAQYDLLKKILLHEYPRIRYKNTQEQVRSIAETVQCVQEGDLPVSLDNGYYFLECLGSDHTGIVESAVNLFHALQLEDLIHPSLQESLLKHLTHLLLHPKSSECSEQIKQIYSYLIDSEHCSDAAILDILQHLEMEIPTEKIDEHYLFLASIIYQKREVYPSDAFIQRLAVSLFQANGELKEKILKTLWHLISAKSKITVSDEASYEILQLLYLTTSNNIKIGTWLNHKFGRSGKDLKKYFSSLLLGRKPNKNITSEGKRLVFQLLSYIHRRSSLFSDTHKFSSALIPTLSDTFGSESTFLVLLKEISGNKRANITLTFLAHTHLDIGKIVADVEVDGYCRAVLSYQVLYPYINEPDFSEAQIIFEEYLQKIEEQQWGIKPGNFYHEERDNFLVLLFRYRQLHDLNFRELTKVLQIISDSDIKQSAFEFLQHAGSDIVLQWLNEKMQSFFEELDQDPVLLSELVKRLDDLDWDIDFISEFLEKYKEGLSAERLRDFLEDISIYDFDFSTIKTLSDKIPFGFQGGLDSLRTNLENQWIEDTADSLVMDAKSDNADAAIVSDGKILKAWMKTLLVEKKWSLDTFMSMIAQLKTENSKDALHYLMPVFRTIYAYQISEQTCVDICTTTPYSSWSTILHEHAIEKHFKHAKTKNILSELITAIQSSEINQRCMRKREPHHEAKMEFSDEDKAKQLFQDIKEWGEKADRLGVKRKSWGKGHIQRWAAELKENLKSVSDLKKRLPEILQVINRACCLVYGEGHEPRQIQILALLALLDKPLKKGALAQIRTGEGKSLIIVMFAVLMGLCGRKVDVLTSNPLLAKRDASGKNKVFYDYFTLKSADNIDDNYVSGLKPCYKKNVNIIYGNGSTFQFDILREEYSGLKTRGEREFDVLIMDEVDSLLIDETSNIAMLSNSMPGLCALNPLFILLWRRLDESAKKIESEFQRDPKDYPEALRDALKDYLPYLLSEQDDNAIKIPNHLKKFARDQAPQWIESALAAYFDYKFEHHYKIEPNQHGVLTINPIDAANTGVVMNGTSWGNGLHQFLQIKHGLEMTDEMLVTNFLSNLELVSRYKNNFYGITGTLGSEQSQKMLDHVYGIDFVEIPTYQANQLVKMPAVLSDEYDAWRKEIIASAVKEASSGRVVLVLCESMTFAKSLYAQISEDEENGYSGPKRLYIDSNDIPEQSFLDSSVESGTLIIATNLAGRGTDLKLSKQAIDAGGLHVCCTFLPANQRVEDQAFGRAARKGEPGTAQLVLYNEQSDPKQRLSENFAELKKARDDAEAEDLERLKTVTVPQLLNKDTLFKKYLALRDQLEGLDKKSTSDPRTFETKHKAVEERWGLWLKSHDAGDDKTLSEFDDFEEEILKDYQDDCVVQNPHYYINQGNYFLRKATSTFKVGWSSNFYKLAIDSYEKAVELTRCRYQILSPIPNEDKEEVIAQIKSKRLVVYEFKNAIWRIHYCDQEGAYRSKSIHSPEEKSQLDEIYEVYGSGEEIYQPALLKQAKKIAQSNGAVDGSDPQSAYMAYYNKAFALVRLSNKIQMNQGGQFAHEDYKVQVEHCLQAANEVLEEHVHRETDSILHLIRQGQNLKAKHTYPHLANQWQLKLNILMKLMESARLADASLECSRRFIDLEFHAFRPSNKKRVPRCTAETCDELLEKQIYKKVDVTFHDFTSNEDLTTRYQSWNTLENAPDTAKINIIFEGQRLLETDKKEALRSLLPINRDPNKLFKKEEKKEKKEEEEAKQEEAVQMPERGWSDVVGFKDTASYIGRKFVNGATGVAASVSSGFSKHISNPIQAKWEKIQDWYSEYEKARVMPVNITCQLMRFSHSIALLDSLKNVAVRKADVHLSQLSVGSMRLLLKYEPSLKFSCLCNCAETQYVKRQPCEQIEERSLKEALHQGESAKIKEVVIKNCDLKTLETLLRHLKKQETSILGKQKKSPDPTPFIPALCSLQFHTVSQPVADEIIQATRDDTPTVLTFSQLDKSQAQRLIYITEEQQNQAHFHVQNLTREEARKLIKEADRTEEAFVANAKSVDEELDNLFATKDQTAHYLRNGYLYFFDIHEGKPMPWKSVALLSAMTAIQITVGVALTVATVGFGANVGVGLITEGISDGLRTFNTLYSREFALSSYLTQKSMSMALSLATAGLVTHFAATSQVANMSDDALRAAIALKKLNMNASIVSALKKLGTQAGEAVGSEALRVVINKTADAVVEQTQPIVAREIRNRMRRLFENSYWDQRLTKAFELDKFLKRSINEEFLLDSATKILSRVSFTTPGLNSLSLKGLDQFEKEFEGTLKEVDSNFRNFQTILEKKFQIENLVFCDKQGHVITVKEICDLLKNAKILTPGDQINLSQLAQYYPHSKADSRENFGNRSEHYEVAHYNFKKLNFGRLSDDEVLKETVMGICLEFYAAKSEKDSHQKNLLLQKLTKLVVDRSAEGAATLKVGVTALLSFGASVGVSKISGALQKNRSSDDMLGQLAESKLTNAAGIDPSAVTSSTTSAQTAVNEAATATTSAAVSSTAASSASSSVSASASAAATVQSISTTTADSVSAGISSSISSSGEAIQSVSSTAAVPASASISSATSSTSTSLPAASAGSSPEEKLLFAKQGKRGNGMRNLERHHRRAARARRHISEKTLPGIRQKQALPAQTTSSSATAGDKIFPTVRKQHPGISHGVSGSAGRRHMPYKNQAVPGMPDTIGGRLKMRHMRRAAWEARREMLPGQPPMFPAAPNAAGFPHYRRHGLGDGLGMRGVGQVQQLPGQRPMFPPGSRAPGFSHHGRQGFGDGLGVRGVGQVQQLPGQPEPFLSRAPHHRRRGLGDGLGMQGAGQRQHLPGQPESVLPGFPHNNRRQNLGKGWHRGAGRGQLPGIRSESVLPGFVPPPPAGDLSSQAVGAASLGGEAAAAGYGQTIKQRQDVLRRIQKKIQDSELAKQLSNSAASSAQAAGSSATTVAPPSAPSSVSPAAPVSVPPSANQTVSTQSASQQHTHQSASNLSASQPKFSQLFTPASRPKWDIADVLRIVTPVVRFAIHAAGDYVVEIYSMRIMQLELQMLRREYHGCFEELKRCQELLETRVQGRRRLELQARRDVLQLLKEKIENKIERLGKEVSILSKPLQQLVASRWKLIVAEQEQYTQIPQEIFTNLDQNISNFIQTDLFDEKGYARALKIKQTILNHLDTLLKDDVVVAEKLKANLEALKLEFGSIFFPREQREEELALLDACKQHMQHKSISFEALQSRVKEYGYDLDNLETRYRESFMEDNRNQDLDIGDIGDIGSIGLDDGGDAAVPKQEEYPVVPYDDRGGQLIPGDDKSQDGNQRRGQQDGRLINRDGSNSSRSPVITGEHIQGFVKAGTQMVGTIAKAVEGGYKAKKEHDARVRESDNSVKKEKEITIRHNGSMKNERHLAEEQTRRLNKTHRHERRKQKDEHRQQRKIHKDNLEFKREELGIKQDDMDLKWAMFEWQKEKESRALGEAVPQQSHQPSSSRQSRSSRQEQQPARANQQSQRHRSPTPDQNIYSDDGRSPRDERVEADEYSPREQAPAQQRPAVADARRANSSRKQQRSAPRREDNEDRPLDALSREELLALLREKNKEPSSASSSSRPAPRQAEPAADDEAPRYKHKHKRDSDHSDTDSASKSSSDNESSDHSEHSQRSSRSNQSARVHRGGGERLSAPGRHGTFGQNAHSRSGAASRSAVQRGSPHASSSSASSSKGGR